MSGKYNFYVFAHTTGSLVETVYNFSIYTYSPSTTFSTGIKMTGDGSSSIIGHLLKTPIYVSEITTTGANAYFSRFYSLSGSWVGSTTFVPYGVSNDV